ncbi:MAG: hypothetical protein AAAC47_00415 [Pararhizobium sp.]
MLPSKAAVQFVLIVHEVADYPAWKAVIVEAAMLRRDAGEISYQEVLKFDGDPTGSFISPVGAHSTRHGNSSNPTDLSKSARGPV